VFLPVIVLRCPLAVALARRVYVHSIDCVAFAEDEGADAQAIEHSRPSPEGVIGQGPETQCWGKPRRPDEPAEPRKQGAWFAPFLPRQATVPDGSTGAVYNGR
jgi:hypothetical protein